MLAVLAVEIAFLAHMNSREEPDAGFQNVLTGWQRKIDSLFAEDSFKGD